MNKIPSQIIDFTLYNGNDKLIGTGSELALPNIVSKTYTADLPSGDVDLPGMRTENMELEVPFNIFDKEAASIISFTRVTTIIARGAAQKTNKTTHDFAYDGIKVTAKGFAKEIELGTLARSEKMDSKIKMTLTYIKVEDQKTGEVFIEIDKFNGTYIINGEDVRAGIMQYL